MRPAVLLKPYRGQTSSSHTWGVALDRVYKSLETNGFLWGESSEGQPSIEVGEPFNNN